MMQQLRRLPFTKHVAALAAPSLRSAANTASSSALLCSARGCSISNDGTASPPPPPPTGHVPLATPKAPTLNNVTLVGVVHDIQSGYVYEDAVCQFTLTTTSLNTQANVGGGAGSSAGDRHQECIVEKDHHTIRCFGDVFSQEVKGVLREGQVVCVNGRLRLNPQLEPSRNKYYYFPYVQVQPPQGQVTIVYGRDEKVGGETDKKDP